MRLPLTGLLIVCCCTSVEKEEATVRAVATRIIEADNRADINKVLSYYHSQAVLYPPGKPAIAGKDAIRKNYESIFATSRLQLTIQIDEVRLSGSSAFVSGFNRGSRTSLEDQTVTDIDDPFKMTLEKEDGEWKIKKLLWN